MIKNGTKPNRIDHRDYDYHKTFGSVVPPTFLDTFNVDAGLTMPNQDIDDPAFTPSVLAMPYGCTNEESADMATDLDSILHRPDVLEASTHANANQGTDVRTSLLAARSLGWISAFFNVRPHGGLDFFDTIRLAMFSGLPENRCVSVGTPWYAENEMVGLGNGLLTSTGIISAPADWKSIGSWHNWGIVGWKIIGDQVYLIGKTWQGKEYGDGGFCYFSRPIINQLMNIPGSVAFTGTKMTGSNPVPITVSRWQYVQSVMKYLLTLIGFSY